MCCNLKLKTLNNQKMTASLRNHQKHHVCSDPCICTTQQYSGVFSEVLHEVWRIFPWSFDIVVTCDVPTKYIIFCTQQTRKQSSFIDNIQHVTWPFLKDFIQVCFSILQWSNVGTTIQCRTCTVHFFRSLLRIFSSFPLIWVCEMKVLWKVASSRSKDLKTVFYT